MLKRHTSRAVRITTSRKAKSWSPNKAQWYWRHEEDYCRKHRRSELDMDEIRDLYGSQIIGQHHSGQMVAYA